MSKLFPAGTVVPFGQTSADDRDQLLGDGGALLFAIVRKSASGPYAVVTALGWISESISPLSDVDYLMPARFVLLNSEV